MARSSWADQEDPLGELHVPCTLRDGIWVSHFCLPLLQKGKLVERIQYAPGPVCMHRAQAAGLNIDPTLKAVAIEVWLTAEYGAHEIVSLDHWQAD